MATKRRIGQYRPQKTPAIRRPQKPSSLVLQRRQPKLRAAIRQAGLRSLKGKAPPKPPIQHPQMWRVHKHGGAGARLGPMGELGDDVIIEVFILDDTLLNEGIPALTLDNLRKQIRDIIHGPLVIYIEREIDRLVPSDTEALRNAMKLALTPEGGSVPDNFPFRIVMNTADIPYAGPVSKMPTDWLTHPASWHPNIGSHSGNALSDPGAKKGWYSLVLLNGRTRARKLFLAFLKHIANLIKGQQITSPTIAGRRPYNIAQKTFAYRGL